MLDFVMHVTLGESHHVAVPQKKLETKKVKYSTAEKKKDETRCLVILCPHLRRRRVQFYSNVENESSALACIGSPELGRRISQGRHALDFPLRRVVLRFIV